jgi:hypothetical protein
MPEILRPISGWPDDFVKKITQKYTQPKPFFLSRLTHTFLREKKKFLSVV